MSFGREPTEVGVTGGGEVGVTEGESGKPHEKKPTEVGVTGESGKPYKKKTD